MRIAIVSDGIPPYVIGGMQKHSFMLVEFLAKAGIRVDLFHLVESDRLPSNAEVLDNFPSSIHEHIVPHTFKYKDDGILPGHYLRAQYKLSLDYFNVLKNIPDLNFILIKGFVGKEILNRRSELSSRCPVGVKFHGMNMFQKQPNFMGEIHKYMLRRPARKIMNDADYVFSYGGKISQIISREVKDQNKIVELPSGIQKKCLVSRPSQHEGPTRFIFVGRYDRLKGLPELYEAIDDLMGENWRFTFVGPIPAAQQKTHVHCEFVGPVNNQDLMFELLDAHDVLVCPSISEGMPNVIIEAMARGLAIIATNVGATALLVQGNGFLIEPQNKAELVKSLIDMTQLSKDQLFNLKQVSLSKIDGEFKWESIIQDFLKFLRTTQSD
ncbi:MAG: glycosyltransferase family 4 protein [Flavobacteriales bacterium]|nr:glycosyltransferase family 4 protein [Flavobacteriales bacterium]